MESPVDEDEMQTSPLSPPMSAVSTSTPTPGPKTASSATTSTPAATAASTTAGSRSGGKKQRSTRACDQCRKTKSKCDLPSEGGACSNCDAANIRCIVSGPNRKRGPPKGYLHAVETRLHEIEAVMGAMLSVPDSRIKSFLDDFVKDSFAKEVIARVDQSQFGPTGRSGITSASSPPAPSSRNREFDQLKSSVNEWQDNIILEFSKGPLRSSTSGTTAEAFGSTANAPFRTTTAASTSWSHGRRDKSSESEAGISDMDESQGDAGAQLVIDNQDQTHFFGRASGLHLLRSTRRDEPTSRPLWRVSQADGSLHSVPPDLLDLPPRPVQEELVQLFFIYIYPHFPLLVKEQFMNEFRNRIPPAQPGLPDAFDILLFAVFSLAARRRPMRPDELGAGSWEDGQKYFEAAKFAIDITGPRVHPCICQALLLLGLRQFGISATSQSWSYIGSAIRMAQDLGLHRSAEHWRRDGAPMFSEDQIVMRKRIWYGCVKIDKYISMYMGRPVSIRENDYDTYLPDELNSEEQEIWDYHPLQRVSAFYEPAPGRFISCFNANIHLSIIVGRTLESFYSVRGFKKPFAEHVTTASDLEKQLTGWMNTLPLHLQIIDHNTMLRAPPHLLNMHMEYWVAVSLLYRPFLRTTNDTHHAGSLSSIHLHGHHSPSVESEAASAKAWEQCISAAQHLIDLAKAWKTNFLHRHAFPFYVVDLFHAGVVWAASLSLRSYDAKYVPNFQFCLDSLEEMEAVYPLAARCRQLLLDANVPFHNRHYSSHSRPPAIMSSSSSSSTASLSNRESFSRTQHTPTMSSGSGIFGESTTGTIGDSPPYVHQLLQASLPGATIDPRFMNGYLWYNVPDHDATEGYSPFYPWR